MRLLLLLALLSSCVQISSVQGQGCGKNYGGCDKRNGLCWNSSPGRSYCACKAGYKFQSKKIRRCVDINECRTRHNECDTKHGRCTNTIGSFKCSCRRGYVLDYTRTKCLRKRDVKGVCCRRSRKPRRKRKHRGFTSRLRWAGKRVIKFFRKLKKGLVRVWKPAKPTRSKCKCEPGFERRGGCQYCQDINECKKRTSMCDLKRGFCHNSDGGYFCTCMTGYVIGPCGFKCYRPSKRPKECTYTNFQTHSLITGESDGLNDEITKSQRLHFDTANAGLHASLLPIKTLLLRRCNSTVEPVVTQRFDLDNNGRLDLIVTYVCEVDNRLHEKSAYDSEAKWTDWTCWTVCKASCHGGIQTRSRTCKNGLVGEGKCKGPATGFKECYRGRKCKKRIRREAHSLTQTQREDLIQAMKKYKRDKGATGFGNAAGSHVVPFQCMGPTGRSDGCCYHGAKLHFAMWHRAELMTFEEGLARHLKDDTLGLPYWDWLKYPNPPPLVWDKTIDGKPNPFASFYVSKTGLTQRSPNVLPELVTNAVNGYLNVVVTLMRTSTIHEFSEALESSHNGIHGAICWQGQNCRISMAGLEYASFDPIFMFHHSNVDRLFSIFQKKIEKSVAWTRQSALEPQENIFRFNEPYQPYRNRSLNPFKKLLYLNSMQDLYYYQQLLGYSYDTLEASKKAKVSLAGDVGKGVQTAKKTSRGIRATDELRLAQYERNTRFNVRIRYFLANALINDTVIPACDKISDFHHRYLGSLIILGSKRERSWKSRQPALVDIHDRMFGQRHGERNWRNGISPDSDLQIISCHSKKIACASNCPGISAVERQLIPSPQLLFYPKYVETEVYKFEWNPSNAFPSWEINLRSVSQWIYFWGHGASHVYHVKTMKAYKDCDISQGINVDCSQGCILPQGVHFFIDGHKDNCKSKGMRLNILAGL